MMNGAGLPGGQAHAFEFEGQQFTLEFDFAAIAAFERVAGLSVVLVLAEMQAGVPKISHVAWLLQSALLKHHPSVTPDECLRMLASDGVQAQLGVALDIAMPPAPEGGDTEAGERQAAGNGTGTT